MPKKYKKNNVIYDLLKFGNDIFNRFVKDKKRFLLAIILVIFLFFIIKRYASIFFTLGLIGLGGLSMIHSRYFRYSHLIGFELCTMATVLVGLAYGSTYGAITGLASIILGFIVSGYFKHTYFISVLAMPLIGLIVPLFRETSLLFTGVVITILYDAIILPLYVIIGGSRVASTVIFFISHLALNIWVFTTIAPFLYNIML